MRRPNDNLNSHPSQMIDSAVRGRTWIGVLVMVLATTAPLAAQQSSAGSRSSKVVAFDPFKLISLETGGVRLPANDATMVRVAALPGTSQPGRRRASRQATVPAGSDSQRGEMLRVAGLLLNRPRTADDNAAAATPPPAEDPGVTTASPEEYSLPETRPQSILMRRLPNGRTTATQQMAHEAAQNARYQLAQGDDEDLLSGDDEDLLTDDADDLLGAPSQIQDAADAAASSEDLLGADDEDLLSNDAIEELPAQPDVADDAEDLLIGDAEELPTQQPEPSGAGDDDDLLSDAEDDLLADEDLLDGAADDEVELRENRGDSLLNQAGPPREDARANSGRSGFKRPKRKPANGEASAGDDATEGDDEDGDGADGDGDDKGKKKKHPQDHVVSNMPHYEVGEVDFDPSAFVPDPQYDHFPYMPNVEQSIYSGKKLNPTERPWIELGRGMYLPGRMPKSQTFMGVHNLVSQHFLVFGDYRTAAAYVDGGGKDKWVWAHRLNLDFDWMLTDTERIHAFTGPIDDGGSFTRLEFDNGDVDFIDALDKNWDTLFFEGDVGSIIGGIMGYDAKFDMPFAVGLMPLLFQNGVWMEDAFVGAAVTLPAQHSRRFGWSNFEVTFFAGIDELDSPAFPGDDSAASVYGSIAFIEAMDGYLEVGYAFLDDTSGLGLGYHNVGVSFSRRYGHRVSNAVRVIVNSGQDPVAGPRTADGALFLLENALISSKPNTFVPYMNLFAGFGRPQSVARAGGSGGVLRNTGILFETDGLTGFPFLDDTANNTYGGAVGFNCLGPEFNYQIILEAAMVQTFGRAGARRAADDQYGVGARYQLPLNNRLILRMDALYGFFENAENISGGRAEVRYKF